MRKLAEVFWGGSSVIRQWSKLNRRFLMLLVAALIAEPFEVIRRKLSNRISVGLWLAIGSARLDFTQFYLRKT